MKSVLSTDITTRDVLSPRALDTLSIVAIAAAAYVTGTILHEHLGHALACAVLGGRITELNAFYVNCDYQNVSDIGIRAVAFAGPLLSLITGIIAFTVLRRLSSASSQLKLFLWLLGSIGWLTATGYLLFSAVTGLGDFGTSRDGALFALESPWLWRMVLFLLGLAGYTLSMRQSLQRLDTFLGGQGLKRVARAQRLSLTSYLAGGLVSILIGLFNPQGIVIVLISAAAASLGGTSGLAWEAQLMRRDKDSSQELFSLERHWGWIIAATVLVLTYAIIFGPSLTF